MTLLRLLALLALMVCAPAARAEPMLGFNLAGIADWSTQQPFLDLMKTARPWIGHRPGQWGGMEHDALRAGGHVDRRAVRSIPDGVERIGTLILTDMPEAARSLAGRYVLRHAGRGRVSVGGRAEAVSRAPNEIRFDYAPGPGGVEIFVEATDPAAPVRDITVVREDRLDLFEAGALFNPDWTARIAPMRLLRFMDWMDTNGATQVRWSGRPRMDDQSWSEGVPLEAMIRLANETGADPWFTLPHMADDDYVARFAAMVRDGLDPRLKAHAEWSNEVWNFRFAQARWAESRAKALWGAAPGGDGWMQAAGLRAAEVAEIWAQVFGAAAERRLVRVIAVHTGWPGLEQPLLEAPLAVARGARPPHESFDAYAVSGYVGHGLATQEKVPDLLRLISEGQAEAHLAAGLRADLEDLSQRLWPHHAGVARRHGLDLVMYEGGGHLAGQGTATGEEAITGLLARYSYTLEMADLLEELHLAWRAAGGGVFTAYLDVARPSRWGSWGALRHLDDDTPRWQALLRAAAMQGEGGRDPAAFAVGAILRGTDRSERIAGTRAEDVLLGGGGDDILVAGPGDLLHGGAGRDRALLPGRARDWPLRRDGGRLLLGAGHRRVSLAGVEEIVYGDEPQRVIPTETLR
ncbi:calcium-binding protein [Limimaricola pyoseonensis]|uniref:Type I secretion C-terminal target domain (VC_A0849 subclass) n=1 Tax=Limimaricola pyoseonensis TaxID=521013 RepID=A0A1G7K2Z3_9RHOB|nr:hypothetical protein [Limimaricola pyoseonensis]SDF31460.1 hypothetical protein SAMN04488567_0102 [Limimaricola pyoseonensis]